MEEKFFHYRILVANILNFSRDSDILNKLFEYLFFEELQASNSLGKYFEKMSSFNLNEFWAYLYKIINKSKAKIIVLIFVWNQAAYPEKISQNLIIDSK